MLTCLDIHNSFVSDVYMDDIADTIRQLYHLHLNQYYIKQQHDRNCGH